MRPARSATAAARGLRRYVGLAAAALGVDERSALVRLGPPATAALALDHRLSMLCGRDLALVWHEERGWVLGVLDPSPDDLLVLRHLGEDVLPAPRVLAALVRHAFTEPLAGPPARAPFRTAEADDDLPARLAGYADRLTSVAGAPGS